MIHISLYWNHICVLHRQEKAFLEKLSDRLLPQGIRLSVRYFGLGYPMHMSEYLAQPDAKLPDLIVSADLEVFEDPRIYGKFSSALYPASGWLPLHQTAALEAARRDAYLLPFASIPLVYYTRKQILCKTVPILECIEKPNSFSFGGINNSAGKTIVKAVWEQYGKETAEKLLKNSLAADMPIGAYQFVRTGAAETALVPSLYAMRADNRETFLQIPAEGPLLVSSYFCARTSIPEAAARRAAEALICPELCNFYAENGDLILHPACCSVRSRREVSHYFAPTPGFLTALDPEEFYALYTKYLPSAHDPLKAPCAFS